MFLSLGRTLQTLDFCLCKRYIHVQAAFASEQQVILRPASASFTYSTPSSYSLLALNCIFSCVGHLHICMSDILGVTTQNGRRRKKVK